MSPGGDTSTGGEFQARVLDAAQSLDRGASTVGYVTVYGGRKQGLAFTAGSEECLVITVWQGVGGTVDEKFPFILANAIEQATVYQRVFIVIGGGGASAGAVDWLTRRAMGARRVHVLVGDDALRGACQRYAAHGEWILTA